MFATHSTELRKLRPAEIYNLSLILNLSDNWKKLMGSVKTNDGHDTPKFSGEFITIVEQAACQERRLAASIFLEEWATMGRKRPTVGLLLDLLMKTELFRAADYLAQNILKVAAPKRPEQGPAAPVDIEEISNLLMRRNLKSESDSNDSIIESRSAAIDIRSSQMNDPSHVSDDESTTNEDNSAVPDNEVGVIEMRYAESRSNQDLGPATVEPHCYDHSKLMRNDDPKKSFEAMSDLMKFSSSDIKTSTKYLQSDLLKFDSEKSMTNEILNSNEAFIPDLSVLRQNSSTDCESKIAYSVASNAEMISSELPACLGNFGISTKSSDASNEVAVREDSYYNRELVTSELPVFLNFNGVVDSKQTDSSSKSRSNDDDSLSENSSNILSETFDSRTLKTDENVNSSAGSEEKCIVGQCGLEKNALNTGELPLTVLEFQNR